MKYMKMMSVCQDNSPIIHRKLAYEKLIDIRGSFFYNNIQMSGNEIYIKSILNSKTRRDDENISRIFGWTGRW